MDMWSALGHEALKATEMSDVELLRFKFDLKIKFNKNISDLGISGGRTDKSNKGSVLEMLGLLDFACLSSKSPSIIISGCKKTRERKQTKLHSEVLENCETRANLDVRYDGYLRRCRGRRVILEHSLQFGDFGIKRCHLLPVHSVLNLDTILQLPPVIGRKASRVTLQFQTQTA